MDTRTVVDKLAALLLQWKKALSVGIGVVVAIIALYFLLRASPVPVDPADIRKGPITVSVQEEGVSRVRDVFVVSAPITGKVLRSPVKVGDAVSKQATLVATLRPIAPSFLDVRSRRSAEAVVNAAQAASTLAKANVAKSRAELEFAKAEFGRAQSLFRRATIPQRTLDQARLRVKTAEAVLQAALAEQNVRHQDLVRARASLIGPGDFGGGDLSGPGVNVYAPVSGRVLRVLHESEQVLPAGSPILELGNPRDLEIVADFLSSDAVQVKTGASATIEQWGGGKTLRATVRRVEPSGFKKVSALGIEEQRVKIRLDIKSPAKEWALLGHDYRVHVRISVWQNPNAVLVPKGALFRKGERWATFKMDDGTAQLVILKVGRQNNTLAEVLNGISPGDQVILHPSDRITDGSRVVKRTTLD